MQRTCYSIMLSAIMISCLLPAAAAAALVWQTSKQAAVDLAVQQNKRILLLAGRDT